MKEVRIMKRKKEKRNKRIFSKALVISLAAACLICLFVLTGKSSVSANASEEGEVYYTSITVEAGDTLSGIAAEYDLSVKEIKKINGIKSDTIYAGESLIVSYTK